MALNWNAETLAEPLLRYKHRYDGKEKEEMHPVLHHLIFLTMVLGGELAGTEKQKQDIKKRVAYITKVEPELVTLRYSKEADEGEIWNGSDWLSFLDYWKPKTRFNSDGTIDGYDILITADTIDRYWGLSTNASRKPFRKWFADFNKRTLELLGR